MEDRKTQIIEIAIELIKKYGYDSFSYADLSKTLGITKASIHHHFPKKDDLGLALCNHIHDNMHMTFSAILTRDISALRKLEAYLTLYEKMLEGGDKVCPVASLQAEANIISKEMKNAIYEIDNTESQFIEQVLIQGKESAEFTIVKDIKTQAILMASSLKGTLLYARIHGKEQYRTISHQMIKQIVK